MNAQLSTFDQNCTTNTYSYARSINILEGKESTIIQ